MKVNDPYSLLIHRWRRAPWPPCEWYVDPPFAIYEKAYVLRWHPGLEGWEPPRRIVIAWDVKGVWKC